MKILITTVVLIQTFTCFGWAKDNGNTVGPVPISVNLTVGETQQLAIEWSLFSSGELQIDSRDPQVATVDRFGLVLAVGYGKTLIEASTKDGQIKQLFVISVPPILAIKELSYDANSSGDLIKNNGIVDVNSTLVVSVDSQQLRKAYGVATLSSATKNIGNRIHDLSISLSEIEKKLPAAIQATATVLKNPSDGNREKLVNTQKDLAGTMETALSKVTSGSRIEAAIDNYVERIKKHLIAKPSEVQQAIDFTNIIRKEIGNLESDIESESKSEGYYIQAGAYIFSGSNSVAVHLPGFDNISESSSNVIPRFQFTLDQNGLDSLNQIKSEVSVVNAALSSSQINIGSLTNIFSGLGSSLSDLEEDLRSFPTNESVKVLRDETRTVSTKVDDFLNSIKVLSKELASMPPASTQLDVLTKFNLLVQSIVTNGTDLDKSIQALLSNISSEKDQAVVDYLGKLNDPPIDKLAENIAQSFKLFFEETAAPSLLEAGAGVSADISSFSDKVLKLDPSSLPAVTRINLSTSGRVGSGDKVAIRLVVGKDGATVDTLDYWSATMARIGMYISTIPGMALVTTYGVGNTFQASVSYSVVLKWGIRNDFWDNILSPGFGLNVAAPDLNRDGTPELGLAGVVLFFHDVLGFGCGFDMNLGVPYWFLNLNLPLSIFGLPASGNSSQPAH